MSNTEEKRYQKDLLELTTTQLAQIYNQAAGDEHKVRTFPSRKVGAERVAKMIARHKLRLSRTPGGGIAVLPSPRAPIDDMDNFRVVVLVDGNPKREGSAARERFELYHNAETAAQYLDQCSRLQGPPPGQYRNDLRWDTERGFIRLERVH